MFPLPPYIASFYQGKMCFDSWYNCAICYIIHALHLFLPRKCADWKQDLKIALKEFTAVLMTKQAFRLSIFLRCLSLMDILLFAEKIWKLALFLKYIKSKVFINIDGLLLPLVLVSKENATIAVRECRNMHNLSHLPLSSSKVWKC